MMKQEEYMDVLATRRQGLSYGTAHPPNPGRLIEPLL